MFIIQIMTELSATIVMKSDPYIKYWSEITLSAT